MVAAAAFPARRFSMKLYKYREFDAAGKWADIGFDPRLPLH